MHLGFDELLERLRSEHERLRMEVQRLSSTSLPEWGEHCYESTAENRMLVPNDSTMPQLLFQDEVQTAPVVGPEMRRVLKYPPAAFGEKVPDDAPGVDETSTATTVKLQPTSTLEAHVTHQEEELPVVPVSNADMRQVLQCGPSTLGTHTSDDAEALATMPPSIHGKLKAANSQETLGTHKEHISNSPSTCRRSRADSLYSMGTPFASNVSDQYDHLMSTVHMTAMDRVFGMMGRSAEDLEPLRKFMLRKRLRCVRLAALVRGKPFQSLVSCLIVMNVLLLMMESDREVRRSFDLYDSQQPSPYRILPAAEPFFKASDTFFTVAFATELLLRMLAEEFEFLCGETWRWNLFDTCLVATSVAQSFISEAGIDATFARLFRVLRMARALRIIRLFKAFHELRVIMDSIFHIIAPLMWSVLTLSLLLFLFCLVFLNGVSSYVESVPPEEDIANLRLYFSSAPKTLLSLFMSLTNGQSWWYVVQPLRAASGWYTSLFVVFIIFLQLGVLNIITSVFVSNAHIRAQKDLDMIAMANAQHNKSIIGQLREVFDLLDRDGNGAISLQEFEEWTKIDKVAAFFERVLNLEAWRVGKFFRLLDINGDDQLEKEEFVVGCMRLKGGAKSVDHEVLTHNLSAMKKDVRHLKFMVEEMHHRALPEVPEEDHAFFYTSAGSRSSADRSSRREKCPEQVEKPNCA